MIGLMNVLAVVAIVVYATFIFMSKGISKNTYRAGDALMAVVLIDRLMKEKTCPLLMISLLWLACNYLTELPQGDAKWVAYDGFAMATVLSKLRLPNL